MAKQPNKKQMEQLQYAGTVLLFVGLLFAVLLDLGRVFQIIGTVLIVLSAVVFGRIIGARSKK